MNSSMWVGVLMLFFGILLFIGLYQYLVDKADDILIIAALVSAIVNLLLGSAFLAIGLHQRSD